MAEAATKKQQNPPMPASAGKPAAVVDPKFEWTEKAGSYVLRLALPGFKKDDFRVQVDGAGMLTVRGTRTGATGQSSLHKVFQLPSAANPDDIAGRFEAGVLTLTVPKRASSATAPTSIEEIKRKLPGVAKPKNEATQKTQQQRKQEEEASKSKQEQQKPALVNKEKVKPKALLAPATAPPQQPAPVKTTATPPSEKPAVVKKEEEIKPNAPQAAAAAATPPPEKSTPKPEKAAVAPQSLAERVRRHGQEERAKAAAAAAAKKEAEAEREKKATTAACVSGWKDRAMGELKGLTNMKWAEGITDMKWADGLVETARKNKEVVAVGVAAFSLGFLVSHKLFRK